MSKQQPRAICEACRQDPRPFYGSIDSATGVVTINLGRCPRCSAPLVLVAREALDRLWFVGDPSQEQGR